MAGAMQVRGRRLLAAGDCIGTPTMRAASSLMLV